MVQNIVMNIFNNIPAALGVQNLITVFKIAGHACFFKQIVCLLPAQAKMALIRLKTEDIKPDKSILFHLQLSG